MNKDKYPGVSLFWITGALFTGGMLAAQAVQQGVVEGPGFFQSCVIWFGILAIWPLILGGIFVFMFG